MWRIVEHAGRRYRVAVARTEQGIWVGYPGGAHCLRPAVELGAASAADASAAGASGPRCVRAPMTGRIVALNVEPGSEVAAGAPLLLLEAMKMEYRVQAPVAGRVGGLTCAVGSLVELGAPLLTLTP